MFNHQRATRQLAGQGQTPNRSRLNPYPVSSPGIATQHNRQRQQQQQQQNPQAEVDIYTQSAYSTQSIIEHLLRASLFAADDPIITRKILIHCAPLSSEAFSPQYRSGNGPSGGIPDISRESLLEFYTRFVSMYTALRGLSLELDALRSIWNHILDCRESVVKMYNLGKPVLVPVATTTTTTTITTTTTTTITTTTTTSTTTATALRPDNSNGNSTPVPPTKIEFRSDPRLIRSFLTVQAGWAIHEVDRYFYSNTALEASLARVEERFHDALEAFFAFAWGLGGGWGATSSRSLVPAPAQPEWSIDTKPGYDPDLLEAVEKVVVEPMVKEVRELEREFWFVGARCPDWEIREERHLARRLELGGMPREMWVVETATEITVLDIEDEVKNMADRDVQVGGEYEIVGLGEDMEMEIATEVEVDWAAVDRAAMMDAKQRKEEFEEFERGIAIEMEKERSEREHEWFRELGRNGHTRTRDGLPRTQNENKKELDMLRKSPVEFMYDDHDCVRESLAQTD